MATIILSLSTKSDKVTSQHEVLIRFFHGKHVNQRTKTNVFVHPDHWSDATQSIVIPKWRTLSKERKQLKDELQQKSERLASITSLVQSSFQEIDKGNVPNDWLKKLIHGFNFPAVTTTAKPKPKQKKSFFDWFELFLKTKNYPHGSTKSFRVVERALGRYQGYKRKRNKDFTLDIDTISKETIIDFFDYFRREHELAQKNPKLFEKLLRDYPAEITQKHKSPKITERGDNHIVNLQKKLKRFFLWLNKEGYSTNRPFDGVEIKAEKYGTPIILTLEERNKIADFDLSSKPHLERQRDVFIFQCLIGCRVGDLLKMTPDNVVNGQIEYIPRKTKDNKPVTAEVPLNDRATAILEKYRNVDLSPYKNKVNSNPLLPFISSQKYNEAIKEVFKICGIDRMVTVLDPVSGEQTQKPFYEIASSHLARRTFVGLLYNQIQDPNLISSMSGHVEGSREFARYRKIEREAKKKAVDLIN
jgi:integrase